MLQIDETPISYLDAGHGSTRNGYLWIARSPKTGGVYYHWATSRAKDELLELLNLIDPKAAKKAEKKQRTIQCDGYKAYEAVAKRYHQIKLTACLAHIRRKFLPPKGAQPPAWVTELLTQIQDLYSIERTLKQQNSPPERRRALRQKEARPICEQIKQTLDDQNLRHRPKSQLGMALSYALNQWSKFTAYLEDGRLEIDNNGAENAVRPTKLGAKNWLFVGHAEAGHQSATIYTILQNCKAVGLNPRTYLEHVFEALKTQPATELTPSKVARTLQAKLASKLAA